jgi:hypothetical protein
MSRVACRCRSCAAASALRSIGTTGFFSFVSWFESERALTFAARGTPSAALAEAERTNFFGVGAADGDDARLGEPARRVEAAPRCER